MNPRGPHRHALEAALPADYVAPTGLARVRYAIAKAAGWEWCQEHHATRWEGAGTCDHLHPAPKPEGWQDYNPMLRDDPAGGHE